MRHGNHVLNKLGLEFDLSEAFFRCLGERFAHRVLLVLARSRADGGVILGGSISFAKGTRICGRYWGYHYGMRPIRHLHFECCYHALVEHAIKHGYKRIEPGNGGGSIFKVQRDRGFEPVLTASHHLVPHRELREEIARLAEDAAREVPSWTRGKYSAYAPSKKAR